MSDLLMIVPSLGRPASVRRLVQAWYDTDAFAHADLQIVIDADDPAAMDYLLQATSRCPVVTWGQWQPMVSKLNLSALCAADGMGYEAIGFMGDDHLPRTRGWAEAFLRQLDAMETGIVYGDDLVQHGAMPTHWAMTTDIVRTLRRMVPAPVQHFYSDTSVLALGNAAQVITYLPEVVIEHLHPTVGTAEWDSTYERTSTGEQEQRDREAFEQWRDGGDGERDAAAVRHLAGR